MGLNGAVTGIAILYLFSSSGYEYEQGYCLDIKFIIHTLTKLNLDSDWIGILTIYYFSRKNNINFQ